MSNVGRMILTHGPDPVAVEVLAAHRPPGVLHEAVSVQLVDAAGNWLLQQRAPGKALFGGRWANTCCTHPRPGEPPVEAGRRRVGEELGIAVGELVPCGRFTYRATDPASGLVEYEHDHVVLGRLPDVRPAPSPDPAEISSVGWLPFDRAASLVLGPHGAPWSWTVLDLAHAALSSPA